ncbi:hypothetical protein JCM11641_006826 [Rhodosporidiobolus odoratus]
MVLAPFALVFAIVPAQLWARVASFTFGLVFFGQPLLIRGFNLLDEKVPDWQDRLDPRNSILSKVSTNAQVVLHVVRVAERAYTSSPLLLSAPTAKYMEQAVQPNGFDADEMGADGYSAETSDQHSVGAGALANKHAGEEDDEDVNSPSTKEKLEHKSKGKIVGAFKKVAKKAAVFRCDVHVEGETTKQKVRHKIDRFFYQSRAKEEETPYCSSVSAVPSSSILMSLPYLVTAFPAKVAFVPLKANWAHPTFEKPIEDLVKLKKRGVWMGRTLLGYAASINFEGMGLDLRFKALEQRYAEKAHGGLGEGDKPHQEVTEGETYGFSHVGRRDELFRRLLGISNARWEVL